MNLGGMTNSANNSMMMNCILDFSAIDQAGADRLLMLEGREISVYYKEKWQSFPGAAMQNILLIM